MKNLNEKRFSPGRWGGSKTKSPREDFRVQDYAPEPIDTSLNYEPEYSVGKNKPKE